MRRHSSNTMYMGRELHEEKKRAIQGLQFNSLVVCTCLWQSAPTPPSHPPHTPAHGSCALREDGRFPDHFQEVFQKDQLPGSREGKRGEEDTLSNTACL